MREENKKENIREEPSDVAISTEGLTHKNNLDKVIFRLGYCCLFQTLSVL